MISKDRIGGVLFVIFGIVVVLMATQIRVQANLTEPGPRLFPYISGIGIAVCGLGMAITAKRQKSGEPYLTPSGWRRLGISGAALILYYLALEYVGFLIATPFFTFAIILILASGKRVNKITAVVISLLTTGILYYLFQKLFSIFLPSGKLF
ncbi:MAG: tripartite tricarboxylate transporter TctB family protein [Oscillospiraceae bacterium]